MLHIGIRRQGYRQPGISRGGYPKEDPIDYHTDKENDKDEEEDSSRDDTNDEEGEHPALANSDPQPVYRVTARMSVRAQTSISLPSETEFARLLAIHTSPPSPLSPLSSPLP
nr:hypothetical protein [Tanacetum cinerariifolium]